MRLTIFTDYALRTLIYLGACEGEQRLATIQQISGAYGISENHLMKVVSHLARQGYVQTVRGKGGGIRLALPAERVNIGAVVRATEGSLDVVDCTACSIEPACALNTLLARALRAFLDVLDATTLAQLIQPRSELRRLLHSARPR
jgi:Rrf2 family nitric oxide-sensitive transcriptional repressor